jgi:hypothetical protein
VGDFSLTFDADSVLAGARARKDFHNYIDRFDLRPE